MGNKGFKDFINSQQFHIQWESVQAVMVLVSEGATVPFIARYRKDKTGNLNETRIREVIAIHQKYRELVQKKESVIKYIHEQGAFTGELKKQIASCWDLPELEKTEQSCKSGKKTKVALAVKAGLNPLAQWIWELGQGQIFSDISLEVKAREFINPAIGFATYQEALRGAANIIVRKIAGHPHLRDQLRKSFFQKGILRSVAGKKVRAGSKYKAYFDYEEKVDSLLLRKNLHHYLTLYLGWNEGELTVSIKNPEEGELLKNLQDFVCPEEQARPKDFLDAACQLAFTAYMIPSIVTEVHGKLKDSADQWVVGVCSKKLRKLLLTSPFDRGPVLGVSPCGRGLCQVSLVDREGRFISNTVLKTRGDKAVTKAENMFSSLFRQIEVHAVAVGWNKIFYESESFIRKILKNIDKKIPVIPVNGSAATVYSDSEAAVHEFQDKDPAVRSAIFIARSLQDPLSEMVRIEPADIDLDQYQRSVSRNLLKKCLNSVVEDCVHFVGVDVNKASEHLLKYVSGIGPDLARKIVNNRKEKGLFKNRDDLTRIVGWSSMSCKQAIGFLRVREGQSLLDTTGIHPERYRALRDMAGALGENVSCLFGKGADKLLSLRKKWSQLIGEYTFDSIVEELKTQGRDPRGYFEISQFHENVFSVEDLRKKMICNGIVSNVTPFGIFVNIGAGQDGLVHISEMAGSNPLEKFCSGDQVSVLVKSIDRGKNQITLTMKFGKQTGTSGNPGKSGKKSISMKSGTKKQKKNKNKNHGDRGKHKKSRSGQSRTPFNNPFGVLEKLNKK